MATGASTADVAILLVDARNGVRAQSRRHARIARLLGITDFVLAVNKMDLVDFDREVFENICDDFEEFLTGAPVHAIPMSALHGDNVITRSERTPWFDGLPLLEYLETVQVASQRCRRRRSVSRCSWCSGPTTSSAATPARSCRAPSAPATASRPGRRAAAPASSGSSPGTATSTLAFAPMSVTLTLDDEIDISRGDVLTVEPAFSRPAVRGRGRLDGRAAARSGARLPAEAQRRGR